jgi:alkylation response protein AidB-like acyl-CoA dehydrogenase
MPNEPTPGAPCAEVLERAQEIAAHVLAPRAAETDQADGPPLDNIRVLAEAGILGVTIPAEYGGQGVSGEVARACQEILASPAV